MGFELYFKKEKSPQPFYCSNLTSDKNTRVGCVIHAEQQDKQGPKPVYVRDVQYSCLLEWMKDLTHGRDGGTE